MKILHITATHLKLASGISTVLRDLVNAQNKIDNLVAKVLSVKADVTEMNSQFFDYLGARSFDDYVRSFGPDVVIFHCHFYFEYIKLYRSLIKLEIPYFIESHGALGKVAMQKSKYKKLIANHLLLRSYLKHAKGFVFLNKEDKANGKYHTCYDLVIPNGINVDEVIEEYTAKEEWSFYFLGRYDIDHKGLDHLFGALDILEQKGVSICFNFYGTGSKQSIDYINKRIENYHSLKVMNCGPLYGDEQKEILERHGIMVLTSRYEGFPMTVLEAWKYGNPCLVTAGTNVMDEVVVQGLGWGTDLDSRSIAVSLLRAKEEYSRKKEEYIQTCKNYVKNKYSWDRIAQISYDRLSEVCNKGK